MQHKKTCYVLPSFINIFVDSYIVCDVHSNCAHVESKKKGECIIVFGVCKHDLYGWNLFISDEIVESDFSGEILAALPILPRFCMYTTQFNY